MYFFYAGHAAFSYRDFRRFIFKRWARLSPAFYAATVIYLIVSWINNHHQYANVIPALLTSMLYLNSVLSQFSIASHLWTLGVEWQFYLLIPFILIYQRTLGFKKIFLLVFGTLFLLAIVSVLIFRNNIADILTDQIFFRGIEFGCGVIAARLLLKNYSLVKNRFWIFLLFIVVAYCGRILISDAAMSLSPRYHNMIKLSGFTLMGAGFAGILYLAITSEKWLNKALSNRVFKTMGKISYSFYLWHALVIPVCAGWVVRLELSGIMAPVLTTLLACLVLYPISYLSYKFLEKPFLSVGNLTTR